MHLSFQFHVLSDAFGGNCNSVGAENRYNRDNMGFSFFFTASINLTWRFRSLVAHLKGKGAKREAAPEASTEGRWWVEQAEPLKKKQKKTGFVMHFKRATHSDYHPRPPPPPPIDTTNAMICQHSVSARRPWSIPPPCVTVAGWIDRAWLALLIPHYGPSAPRRWCARRWMLADSFGPQHSSRLHVPLCNRTLYSHLQALLPPPLANVPYMQIDTLGLHKFWSLLPTWCNVRKSEHVTEVAKLLKGFNLLQSNYQWLCERVLIQLV